MRPNSLFFDRGENKRLATAVSMLITIVFLVLMGYMLIRYRAFTNLLRTELLTTPMFGALLLLYVALAVLSVVIIRWANCRVRRQPALWAVAIFLVALMPRVLYLLALRAPRFGGEVFGRANLSAFFQADNRLSFVLLLVSALSALVVYLIARYLDEGSAPAAGLLFALYPAQIVLAGAESGLQATLFFALLSVLFSLVAFTSEKRTRVIAFSALSGLMLAVCGLLLATAWLVALAFFSVWLVLMLSSLRNKKEAGRLLYIALAFCAVFFSLRVFVLDAPAWGSLDQNLSGATSAGAAQQAREGAALLDSLNWDNLQKGYNVQGHPVRLDQSVSDLWLEKDAALSKAGDADSLAAAGLTNLMSGIRLLDFFFLAGVYLFAWIGGLLRRRGGTADLILWVFLIWAMAHLFSDRIAITRALGAPLLMIFAAYGVFAIVGTEPRPRELSKYESCVNRGALNLGDIPPTGDGLQHTGAFHPSTGGAQGSSSGVYAAMEAELKQQQNKNQQNTGE